MPPSSEVVRVSVCYGARSLHADLPRSGFLGYLKAGDAPAAPDPVGLVRTALRHPIGAPPLDRLVRPGARVAVIVPDRTRPMPLQDLLRPVLDEIARGGGAVSDVTIVAALGSHRAMTDDELVAMLGEDIVRTYRVVNHDWAAADLVDLGVTEMGVPVKVNRRVCGADVKVGLSAVKPHREVGWSGGGKIIDPGVCGAETIGMTHWRGVRFSADEIMGVADNPVRREIERVATRVGLDFSLNAVLNRRNQLVDVKAGHHVAAHRAAVAVADPLYRVAPSARADVLIGGSASWASDLWSGIGAVFLGERFVRPGGTVVAAAPCPDGVAPHHPEILQYGYRPLAEIEAMVDAGRFSDLAAASHMTVVGRVRFGMGVRCILVSDGLGRDVVERLGLEWAPSLQEAVDRALAPYTQPVTVYACQAEDVADMMVLPRKDRGPVAA